MNILKYLRVDKKLLLATLLLVFLEMLGTLYVPTLSALIINNGVINGDMPYIVRLSILMFFVAMVVAGISLLNGFMVAKLSASLSMDLRNAIYEKSLELSVSDFNNFSTGSMITRTSSDVNQIQQAFMMVLQILLPIPIIAVVSVYMTFAINAVLGFVLLGFAGISLIFAVGIVKRTIPVFGRLQKLLDATNSRVRSFLTGVRVIRAFNREEVEEEKVNDSFNSYAITAIKANRLFALMNSTTFLIMNILIVAILFVGGIQISYSQMKLGDIVAVTEYAILLLFYIVMGQMVMSIIPRAGVSVDRIIEVLEFEPSIVNHGLSDHVYSDTSKPIIEFQNVGFRYPDSERNVLSNLSFKAVIGQTTAIIGGTGSGKSTVASLLLRLHEATEGTILLSGNDINTLTQDTLRSKISYVPQKATLFSGTIESNLRFANENVTESEILHSLDIAQATEFVSKLNKGIYSFVAQGGSNFSGGQKQRLSIARALTRHSDIYLFDDCFSALDFKTEANLRSALRKATQHASVIIIAQRISTIRDADQIIVLDEGNIVGIGKHIDLLNTSSVYKQIVDSQEKEGATAL